MTSELIESLTDRELISAYARAFDRKFDTEGDLYAADLRLKSFDRHTISPEKDQALIESRNAYNAKQDALRLYYLLQDELLHRGRNS